MLSLIKMIRLHHADGPFLFSFTILIEKPKLLHLFFLLFDHPTNHLATDRTCFLGC